MTLIQVNEFGAVLRPIVFRRICLTQGRGSYDGLGLNRATHGTSSRIPTRPLRCHRPHRRGPELPTPMPSSSGYGRPTDRVAIESDMPP